MNYQLISPREQNISMIEQVLLNRGIKSNDINHYLHTSNSDILEPSIIDRIHQGAQMLIKHISQNDKIFIQVDSDCDGYTSAALLINYLNRLFPGFVQNNISYRLHEGKQHGIIYETIPKDVKLVIAPDSSSNNYDVHEQLYKDGIDVLIIDHHEAEQISKYACVINNQLCDYPTKSLSGVGMVYKFCSYIDSILNVNYADDYLDLVALGLIADVMDLRDFETRHLITRGMNQIRNPYFKGMTIKNAFSLGEEITPFGVAFYIAPYINAVTRCGTQEEKLVLFDSMLDFKAYELITSTKRGCKGQLETRVEQACRNCTNIKNRQTKIRDNAVEIIETIIKEQHLLDNKILIIGLDNNIITDRNLTGLIANQLMSKYQRPVLLLNKTDKGYEGSGRGYDKSELMNFREFLNNSGLVLYAEGHAQAFGIGIATENLIPLINYTNNKLINFNFTPSYKVDFILNNSTINSADILEITDYEYLWGQGVEEPLIAVEHINVYKNNVILMSPDKNPTLKIILPNGISLIKFKSSQEEFESFDPQMGYITLNIIGRCKKNVWNNQITPQILIEDYEITGRAAYYF